MWQSRPGMQVIAHRIGKIGTGTEIEIDTNLQDRRPQRSRE